MKYLDAVTKSVETLKPIEKSPLRLEVALKQKMAQMAYTHEINTVSFPKHVGNGKIKVSDSIILRYKGRNHPAFEIKKASNIEDFYKSGDNNVRKKVARRVL